MDYWIGGLSGTPPALFIHQSNHPSIRSSPGQRLVHFSLVKKPLFRLERTGVQNPDQPSVCPIHAENPDPAGGHSQIKKTRLNRKPRRVGQEPDGKRIFKGFLDFPLGQRTIQLKGRIVPIKLHGELVVIDAPIQCLYIVFTRGMGVCQGFLKFFRDKIPDFL
jgi:hypothetical protein